MKKHNSQQYETVNISIDPIKHPIAYKARVDSLLLSGMSKEEAEFEALEPIEMELYFEPAYALFMVESDAVEGGTIVNPYSGEYLDDEDDEDEEPFDEEKEQ